MDRLHRLALHVLTIFNVRSVGRYMILGAVVGVVAGLGAVAFFMVCQGAQHLLLDSIAGYRPLDPPGEPRLFAPTDVPFRRYLLIVIPAIGGLLAGILAYRFAPEAAGHGTDAAIEAFHHKQGRIRGRVPLIKGLASALTLGSGGSGGREGPIAQIGAGFGSFLADALKLSSRDRRILLAAGLGAGVGSIFRAPLAGALFAAEVLYREPEFESDVIIPATVTTIVAYSTFGLIVGFNPLFKQDGLSFSHPLELAPYTVLAFVVALAAPVYIKCFYGTARLFKRSRVHPVLRPAIGGLLVGCIGCFLPQTLGVGYGVIQEALDAKVAAAMLLVIALGKIVTTSLTIGSGGSAGVFGPSMVIGAALGGVVGRLFHQLMPSVVAQPGAFVIVGMAGFFSAASHAPISTIIMVSEMTGNYNLLVPAMWVCAIAFILCRRWSIFHSQVPTRADSPAHYGVFVKDVLEEIHVRDVFDPSHSYTKVPEHYTLRQFLPILASTDQQVFPVVDGAGRLSGLFSINDMRDVLVERNLDNLLIMKDIARDQVPSVVLDDSLSEVMRQLTREDIDMLPVVDAGDRGRLVGMLRRNDVTRGYYERVRATKTVESVL